MLLASLLVATPLPNEDQYNVRDFLRLQAILIELFCYLSVSLQVQSEDIVELWQVRILTSMRAEEALQNNLGDGKLSAAEEEFLQQFEFSFQE